VGVSLREVSTQFNFFIFHFSICLLRDRNRMKSEKGKMKNEKLGEGRCCGVNLPEHRRGDPAA
jgi:hypothetical protein